VTGRKALFSSFLILALDGGEGVASKYSHLIAGKTASFMGIIVVFEGLYSFANAWNQTTILWTSSP